MAVRQAPEHGGEVDAPVEPAAKRPPSAPPKSPRQRLRVWIPRALLLVASLLFLLPFAWLVSASLKPREDVFSGQWIPDPVQWENYTRIFDAAPVALWLWNSLLVGFLAAVTVTLSSSLVAFAFAYFRFKGRACCSAWSWRR